MSQRVNTTTIPSLLCLLLSLVVTAEANTAGHAASGSVHAELRAEVRQPIEDDWVRQEQVTRKLDVESLAAVDGVLKRGRALAAKIRKLGGVQHAATAAKRLDAVQSKRDALARKGMSSGKEWRGLYLEARWAVRELAFANPLLNFDKLLFVRRYWPQADTHYFHHLGAAQEVGADLCVLTGLSPDGKLDSLIAGKLAPGGVGRPDLSYDATRALFPYAAPAANPTRFPGLLGILGGACDKYHIYEISIDGSGLRRLIDAAHSEDTEPCYLPNGRIAFTSSRDGFFVQCFDYAPVFSMFSMASDGSDIRRVTVAKEGEWYPSMLDDGRIMYTRWEYVMKPFESIQNIWTVYPDGTHAQLAYGDQYAFSEGPRNFFEARQIPGTSKVLCVGAGHHNSGVGPLLIVDLNKNRGGADGFTNLTAEVPFPEMGYNEEVMSDAGWYASPYPLSEDFYLVCYSFEPDEVKQNGYGLYILDRFGNKELIYRDPAMSCYSPIPVAPRKRPLILPDSVAGRDPNMPGKMILADVYQGLPGVKRGTVKYLRVLESLCKPIRTNVAAVDMGAESGLDPRSVIGTVPVELDGSAYFLIPPDRPIFFEALDENYLEVRRMRSFVSARPGEIISCLGCHEDYNKIESRRLPAATSRPPSEITPPPWGKGVGMSFRGLVQPVLDGHCVSCHDGSRGVDKSFDLRGEKMVRVPSEYDGRSTKYMVSQSFMNLLPYVSYIRLKAYDNGNYNDGNLPLAPFAIGSGVSELMKLLKAGHKGVKLPAEDWQVLAAWIDCNAPFYGGWEEIYFPGERSVRQRKAELAKQAPSGYKLAAYLDCGLRRLNQQTGGPALYLVKGSEYAYYVGDLPAPTWYASIARSGGEVSLQCINMDPGKSYRLGLSWWDYDGLGAIQSVIAASYDGKVTRTLLADCVLPVWNGKDQMPEQQLVDIFAEVSSRRDIWIKVVSNGGKDALLSEMWLYETVTSTFPESK